MPILYINTGTSANAGDGDSLRTAFHKINQSLAYLQGEYVQRGVSSVNNKSGAVVLESGDIEDALGYVAYPETNPANYISPAYLVANSYITTASLVAFNYITLGNVATYLSQNQYVDEPLLDSKLQELTETVGALNQATLDAALGTVLTTSTLDTLIAERNIVNETRLSQATAILQAQIELYPDLSRFVTFIELEEFDKSSNKLISQSKQSTTTFLEKVINVFENNTVTSKVISNLEFNGPVNIDAPFQYGTQNQLSEFNNRLTILNDRTIIDVARARPIHRGYQTPEKSFQFTARGLEFNNDFTRYSKTLAQNVAFTMNAERPKRPQSPGVPGQMYVPNQYEIVKDPYIYLCIDNSEFTKAGVDVYHTNWVRIPVDPYFIGSKNNFPSPNSIVTKRPTGAILYPTVYNPDRNFVFVRNQTYTTSTSTLICMHLEKTGNYTSWEGSELPPTHTAPAGWTGSNTGNVGTFTYTIRDFANNITALPPGLTLSVTNIDQQIAGSGIVEMPIMGNVEDPGYAVEYRGTVFHLTGTPTTEFTSTNIFYINCYDPYDDYDGFAWIGRDYHLSFYITVVTTSTGLTVPTVPIG